jgi:anti-sigma regulatory factor (Ser/Thr protein kinase)
MAESAETVGQGMLLEPLHRVWPAQALQLAPLRREMLRWLEPLALSEDAEDDLVLAVNEAASNCMEHAYRPATIGDTVDIRCWTEPHAVFVEIVDHGRWRTPTGEPTRRGRGIVMMQRLMASFEIHHDTGGTRVLLCQALPGAPQPQAAGAP